MGAWQVEFGIEGSRFSLATPCIPVEAFGDWFCGRGADVDGAGVAAGVNDFQFADASVADEFAAEAAGGHRSLLASGLDDAFVFTCGVDEDSAFADGEGQWFFAVDVFARLAGVDAVECVPVIRGCDDDGIDVGVLEHFSVVGVFFPGFVAAELFPDLAGGDFVESGLVDVADGDDLGAFGESHDLAGTSSDAYVADVDAIVGACATRRSQYA